MTLEAPAGRPVGETVLEVEGLDVTFATPYGPARGLEGVSFRIVRGETVGIVGETGSGKTLTALAILGLVPPPGRITAGKVVFLGEDLREKSEAELRHIRGGRIGLVFQDPTAALNPVFTVGDQVTAVLRAHLRLPRRTARARVGELFRQVGLPDPERAAERYPHELSGGMRQRVMLAIAIACRPRLLLADEPTTALDVTVQAQILLLLESMKRETGSALMLITHDLGVVAQTCDSVCVMYAGRMVESGSVDRIFAAPQHPYTQALLRTVPRLGQARDAAYSAIPGSVPGLVDRPSGCPFHPRCEYAIPICSRERPATATVGEQSVACHRYATGDA